MAESTGSPRPSDSTPAKKQSSNMLNNILVDSDTTPKSLARRFQSPGNSPLNIRRNTRAVRGRQSQDVTAETTDDEYFAQPMDPKQHKKSTRGKKNNKMGTADKATGGSKTNVSSRDSNPASAANSTESIINMAKANKNSDTDTFNMISDLLNSKTERLERQIDESSKRMLVTMEEKMDAILGESERRIHDRISTIERESAARMDDISARITKIEQAGSGSELTDQNFATFSTTINQQLDLITDRIDTNLTLIKENADKIVETQIKNTVCPNEDRVTRVENNADLANQEHRNFSLILTGLGMDYQNVNGVIGFARDMLGIYIDPNEISEVLKLGFTKQKQTVTKVVFFSVGLPSACIPG